jgi:hypothetical protein
MKLRVIIWLFLATGCAPNLEAQDSSLNLQIHEVENHGWRLTEMSLPRLDAHGQVQLFALSEDEVLAIWSGDLHLVGPRSTRVLPLPQGEQASRIVGAGTSRIILGRSARVLRDPEVQMTTVYGIERSDDRSVRLRAFGRASICNVVDALDVAGSLAVVDACDGLVRLHYFDEEKLGSVKTIVLDDMRQSGEPRVGIWSSVWRLQNTDGGGILVVGPAPLPACGFGLRAIRLNPELEIQAETDVCLAEVDQHEDGFPRFAMARTAVGFVIAGSYETRDRLTAEELMSPADSAARVVQRTIFQGEIAARDHGVMEFDLIAQLNVPQDPGKGLSFAGFGDQVLVLEGRRNDSNPNPVHSAWDCSGYGDTDQDFRADFELLTTSNQALAFFEAMPGGRLDDLHNTLFWSSIALEDGRSAFVVQSPPGYSGSCVRTGQSRLLMLMQMPMKAGN